MTSHEIARKLLDLPDVTAVVLVGDGCGDFSLEEVGDVALEKDKAYFDEGFSLRTGDVIEFST